MRSRQVVCGNDPAVIDGQSLGKPGSGRSKLQRMATGATVDSGSIMGSTAGIDKTRPAMAYDGAG